MNRFSKIISISIFLCFLCCIFTAIAGAESPAAPPVEKNQSMQPGNMPPFTNGVPPDFTNDTAFQEQMLKDLTSKGVDTTDLKAAFAGGDQEKIRSVMEGLRDRFPQPSVNGTPGKEGMPQGPENLGNETAFQDRMVKDLESKGVDTTGLKAAIASGDQEKIRTLMDGLRDSLPRPYMNGTPGKEGMPRGNEGPMERPAGKPEPGNNGPKDQPADKPAAGAEQTQSPLSPLTILAGLGSAGLAIVSYKRQ